MIFHKIDLQNWSRTNLYRHFSQEIPCTYSMVANIDVTPVYHICQERNLKFFGVMLYLLTKTVNTHKEFRFSQDSEGNIGYYDITHPCFATLDESTEIFSNLWCEYDEHFTAFYENYLSANSEPTPANCFTLSCIPWVHFTGFNLNLQKGYHYYPPIFTTGKIIKENNKVLLPLALQVHHAVCDGFHCGKFMHTLEDYILNFK